MCKIKIILIVSLFLFGFFSTKAQIDKYALMALTSLTTAEMNSVVEPNVGSIIYNSTENSPYYFDGTSWKKASFDNLGDHNATTRLWMNGNEIQGAGNNTLINGVEIGQMGHGASWLGIANRNRANASGYALIQNDAGTTLLNTEPGQRIGFRVGNSEKMTMSSAGNFGIGTGAPQFKLHVSGRMKMDGSDAGTWIEAGATDWFIGRQNSDFRIWYGNNKFYLNTAGNMWNAGTSTIGNLPIVTGSTYASVTENDGVLKKQTWESIKNWIVSQVPSSADNLGNHNATTRLWMNGNEIQGLGNNTLINDLEVGRMGFGASWSGIANKNRANTSGYALIQNDNGTTLLNSETGQKIGFRVANSEKMTMLASGNFGIGTTNPNRKLEINSPGTPPIRLTQQRANQSPTLGNENHHVLVVTNNGDVKTKLIGKNYSPNNCSCTGGGFPYTLPSDLFEFSFADGNWSGNGAGNTTLADFILPTAVNARAAGHSNGDVVIINRSSGYNTVIGRTNTNLASNYLIPRGGSVGFILGRTRWYRIF